MATATRTPVSAGRRVFGSAWTWWLLSRGGCLLLLASVREYNGVFVDADVKGVYYRAAQAMAHGLVPYRDFDYEYPPGTLPFIALDRLISGAHPGPFTAVWALFMLALDAVVLAALLRMAGGPEGSGRAAPAVMLWLAGGTVLFWILLHNDLVVVAPVVLALALTARRPALAGASWAFGAVAKVWPAALLVAIAVERRAGRVRFVAGAALVLAATTIALAIPRALHAMVSYLVSYQGHRPIEIESSWADVRWVHAVIDGTHLHVKLRDGAPALIGGHAALFARAGYDLTTVASVLAILVPLGIRWRSHRPVPLRVWAWLLSAYVLATLLVAPVFSDQYAVWTVGTGAAVLALDTGRTAILAAVGCWLVAALTGVLFPFYFVALMHGGTAAVVVLTARTVAVAGALTVALVGLVRSVTSHAPRAGAAAGSRPR